MNIAIFEPEHFETVKALVLLFNTDEHTISIFTNAICYRQLMHSQDDRLEKCQWIVRQPRESKYRFLFRFYADVRSRKMELVLLNTVNDNFILHALGTSLLKNVRVVLGVHDINSYFKYKPAFSIRRWVRNTGKMYLVSLVKEFTVASSGLAAYLKTIIPPSKTIYCVPGAVYEGKPSAHLQPEIQSVINLVVAGTIDARRRDYELVFDVMVKASAVNLPLSVVMLGTASGSYGTAIHEKCRAYSQTNHNLKFYDSTLVDQPEFDRVMDSAHFVFIPSVINTVIFDDIEEVYGVSKSSGNLSDVIKHAKPFIIPRALQVDPYLEKSCIRYNSADEIVAELMFMLYLPGHYEAIIKQALEASLCYTIEKVRRRNEGLFHVGHQNGPPPG